MRAVNNTQDDLAVRTAYHDHLHSIYAGIPASGRGNFTLAMRTFHECASNSTSYMLKFKLTPDRQRPNPMGPPDEYGPYYI